MAETLSFEQVLERDGRLVYTNKGVSMLPLLREDRDLMVIDKKPSEGVKKWDAVLFRRPGLTGRGAYVLHRVLRVNGDGSCWIVGDNCLSGETVKEENILGVLRAVVRDGRTIPTDSRRMRAYVWLWCVCPPLRFFLLRLRNYAFAALRRVKRLLGK